MCDGSSSTYGEITVKGFRELARRIELGVCDNFLDLGSGVGRTVVQAALEFGCQQSYGVEMSRSRHRRAQLAVNGVIGKREQLHALMPQVCFAIVIALVPIRVWLHMHMHEHARAGGILE